MGVPAFAVAPNARDLMKGMPGEFPGLAKLAIFIGASTTCSNGKS
jgi:hypothetical protein